jgi:hypothetical protein
VSGAAQVRTESFATEMGWPRQFRCTINSGLEHVDFQRYSTSQSRRFLNGRLK